MCNTSAPSEHRKFKWRYWVDFIAGTRLYLDHRIGDPPSGEGDPAVWDWVKGAVEKKAYKIGIEPWQWWRIIGVKPFTEIRERLPATPLTEDPGRSELLALGFRLVGGVSPYLLLWIGAFAALPVLLWTTWEFFDAGWGLSGSIFVFSIASCPFVVDCLALPHSAVGFYVLGLLGLVPFAAYGLLGRPTPWGAALRLALGALLLALCARCRSDTMALFPGWGLAIGLVSHRLLQDRRPASKPTVLATLALATAGVALLLLPRALTTTQKSHNTWFTIWEGLGDFDRSKGHRWSDQAAWAALKNAGIPVLPDSTGVDVPPEGERYFRRLVPSEIASDPLWFARILAQRVVATTTLFTVDPWTPVFALSEYFDKTSPVDMIGFRTWQWRLPAGMLQLPTLLLLGYWGFAVRRGQGADAGQVLRVVLCVGIGALALPVLVSVMGGQETEAFSLVHFLSLAFLLELWGRVLREKRGTAEGQP